MDDFRGVIRKHPLLVDYVVDELLALEVVRISGDGTVCGCMKLKVKMTEGEVLEWQEYWPDRDVLLELLKEPQRFRAIQNQLRVRGEKCGHWTVLHALYNLVKEGLVVKIDKEYGLKQPDEVGTERPADGLLDEVLGYLEGLEEVSGMDLHRAMKHLGFTIGLRDFTEKLDEWVGDGLLVRPDPEKPFLYALKKEGSDEEMPAEVEV